MSFVNEVYNMYRDQMNDDEDDAVTIVLNLLEDQSKENIQSLIDEMTEDEIMQMMGVYLVEMLKMKMVQDGKLPSWKSSTTMQRLH